MLCAVSCKILSAGTDLLTSDSYFSSDPSQFSGAVFFSKTKMVGHVTYFFIAGRGMEQQPSGFFMLQNEDFSAFLKKGL